MKKILGSFLSFSGTVLLAFSAFPASAGVIGARVNESDAVADNVSIEVGVATKGTALYRALVGAGNQRVAEQLTYRFEVPADVGAEFGYRSIRSILEAGASSQQKVLTTPEDPNPPTGGGRIGQNETNLNSCASVGIGSSLVIADVVYTYEYQYTRDTDGDKKPDADPEWVLTGMEMRPLAISMAVKCQ